MIEIALTVMTVAIATSGRPIFAGNFGGWDHGAFLSQLIMSEVLTEGRVSKNVLSFGEKDFLFTGTVCKSWRENSASVDTNINFAFRSPSRILEAVDNGIADDELPCFLMERAFVIGAKITMFEKLLQMGFTWNKFMMNNAIIENRLDLIKFVHKHGCPLDEEVLYAAVEHNSIKVVEYFADHSRLIDEMLIEDEDKRFDICTPSMEKAIVNNNLDIVKCLRVRMDFPFDNDAFRVACNALCGTYEPGNRQTTKMLEYLHAEGCTPEIDQFHDCIEEGNYHAVEFMLQKKLYENKLPIAMRIAVVNLQGDIMRLLMAEDFFVSNDVVDLATYDLGIVKWFMEERVCTITPGAYINTIEQEQHAMSENCCIEALDWLRWSCGFRVDFKTFDELLQNERWSSALDEWSPRVSKWFQDNI